MKPRKRVFIGYVRTTGEEEAAGRSLDEQVEAIRDFAQREDVAIEEIYYDRGIPGKAQSFRTGIFNLLDEIEIRRSSDLIVVHSNRLIRDGEIGRQILKELEKSRVTVHSLSEDPEKVRQDTRRITSSTVAALKSASTKIDAVRRGKAPAGRAAFGYRRAAVPGETTTRLEVVPEEADTVRWIFREYLRERSMAKVADGLARRNVAAPGGKEWSRASVAWILNNEVYIGRVKFGSVTGEGEHDPIVATPVFDWATYLRNTNRRAKPSDAASQLPVTIDDLPREIRATLDAADVAAIRVAESEVGSRAMTSSSSSASSADDRFDFEPPLPESVSFRSDSR